MRVPLGLGIVLLLVTATAGIAQTRITKVSPATLRIQAGGDPVPLTLEGVELASVTSVRALLGGRPVTGLEGALRTAAPSVLGRRAIGSANRLVVDLAATEAVQPGRYQLEVVAGRQRIRVPVSITVVEATAGLQPSITVGGAIAAPTPLPPPSITVEEAIAAATPVVTSANPTTVDLVEAGPFKTVVLQGANLDRMTGGHMERNGARVHGVAITLQPSADPTRREVILRVQINAEAPWNVPLDLVLEGTGARGLPQSFPTPVQVKALGTVRIGDPLFADAIDDVIGDAAVRFNSCGASAANRRFAVNLPRVPHSSSGAVLRLEKGTSVFEKASFLEDHTLDPSDIANPQELGTLHVSLIPHTVTAVRMCVDALEAAGNWKVTGAAEKGATPELIVTVELDDVLFRVRGMPVDPITHAPFFGWGDPITDQELSDRQYVRPQYEVRLPLEVSSDRIVYGSAQVTFRTAGRWIVTFPVVREGVFLGPSGMRRDLEAFAEHWMRQIASEIRKAFEASATRDRISSSIMSALPSKGIGGIVGLARVGDDRWHFVHR